LIQVTVPITALLGVDERQGQLDTGQLIPAEVVRDLMSHPGTVFHRLLTDSAGRLLEYSPGVYRPKAEVYRRHHRYKHAAKAEVGIEEDGTATIKTRWGQTYTTKPEPVEEPPF
jgi:hypothetical protein